MMSDKTLKLQRVSQFEVPSSLAEATSIIARTACGPACLSMISLYYNQQFNSDLNPYITTKEAIEAVGFRWHGNPEEHVIAEYGVEAPSIIKMAENFGYDAEFLKKQSVTKLSNFIDEQTPPILFVGPKNPEEQKGLIFKEDGKRWEAITGEHLVVLDGYKTDTDGDVSYFYTKDPLHPSNMGYTREELFAAAKIKAHIPYKGKQQLLDMETVLIYPNYT